MDHTHVGSPNQETAPDRGGWTRIDNAVVPVLAEIGDCAAIVYLALKMHADSDGVCWPSREAIAYVAGVSQATVKRKIAKFVTRGLLTRESRNGPLGHLSNRYRFTTPSIPRDTLASSPSAQVGHWAKSPRVMGDPRANVSPRVMGDPPTGHGCTTPRVMGDPRHIENKNKTHRTRLKNKTRTPLPPKGARAGVDPLLVELIDQWNALPRSIAPAVRKDPPPKALLAVWQRTKTDPELLDALQDVPSLIAAIRKAHFCHGKGFFTLPWVFTTDPHTKELRVHKLLNGAYESNGQFQQTSRVSSDRFVHDPNRPIAKTL